MKQQWTQAVAEETLAAQGRVVFREEDKQIALLWSHDRVFAVDNRCPHQGYPLSEGTLEDGSCVLTCQWHNWKFDVTTGECIQGEDHVRTYPTRRAEGMIWLDLSEPSAEAQREGVMQALRVAVRKQQFGRVCRELARLSKSGADPTEALAEILVWRSEHFEFGMTHAHGVSADWLQLYDESEGDREQQLLCLAEAIDHIAHDSLRHPQYPYSELVEAFDGEALLAAIEAEDEPRAIAQLRGALEAGLGWSALEPWMLRAALRHYNDFGHALIFVQKTGELIKRLGSGVIEHLLFPLVRSFCVSTREDMLPMFRRYADFLAEAPTPTRSPRLQGPDSAALERLWSASVNQAMAWVNEQLAQHSIEVIFNALLESCARALLYYNPQYQEAYDKAVAHNIGWLHFTHALTFAHAARVLCSKNPELWPAALLQMACFSGRHQSYQDREQKVDQWFVDGPADSFFAESAQGVCDHGLLPPIFSAHLLKTLFAVREEYQRLSADDPQQASCRRYLQAALRRFLQAPLKQKHVRRTMRQALALVG